MSEIIDPGTGLPLTPEEIANQAAPVVEGETTVEPLSETPVTEESNETGTEEGDSETGDDDQQG